MSNLCSCSQDKPAHCQCGDVTFTVHRGPCACRSGQEPGPGGEIDPETLKEMVKDLLPDLLPENPQKMLAANLDLYVSPEGSDGNDGLAAESPLQTIAAALAKTVVYARSPYKIIINLAAGSYLEYVTINFCHHYPDLIIKGTGGMSVIENGLFAYRSGLLTLEDLHIKQTSTQFAVLAQYGAFIFLRNNTITVSGSGVYAIQSAGHSSINIYKSLNLISVGAVATFFMASSNGYLSIYDDARITASGVVNKATAVATFASGLSVVAGAQMGGTVTGTRYGVWAGSRMNVPAGSATFFPGTVAGTVSSGSSYEASS